MEEETVDECVTDSSDTYSNKTEQTASLLDVIKEEGKVDGLLNSIEKASPEMKDEKLEKEEISCDSEVDSETEDENNIYIPTGLKISAIDFLFDKKDDNEYLDEYFPVKCEEQENRRDHEQVFYTELTYGQETNEMAESFSSLNLKTVGFPKFGFHFYNSLQLNTNKEQGFLTMESNSSHSSFDPNTFDENNEEVLIETTNKNHSNSIFLDEVTSIEESNLNCKVNPLFVDNYEVSEDEDDSLIHAVDMLKEFFDQMNVNSPSKDTNNEDNLSDEQSSENDHFLGFYLDNQRTTLINALDISEDVILTVSGMKSPVTNLESIEEEKEEDIEHEYFTSEYKEISDTDNLTVNDDSQNYIKVAIREMFPISNSTLNTKCEPLIGPMEHKEPTCCLNNDDDDAVSLDSADGQKSEYSNGMEEHNCITTNDALYLSNSKPMNEWHESDDESDTESTSSESDVENDSYLNSSEKISAMNFLLDDSLDYLDSKEFFPREFDKHDNLVDDSEHLMLKRNNNLLMPHKLDLFSNHHFENTEIDEEDSYSDTSSEAQSIDSIRYIEDTEDDCLEEEDVQNDQHDFISEMLNSLLIQSMSEPDHHNELDNHKDSKEDTILPFENKSEESNEDELFCESPLDDFHSDTSSEKGVSTDEGIVASSDEEKEIEKDYKKARAISSYEDKTELIHHNLENF
eukprot:TRINITY_DN22667_c0_g1_i5.p1 TRINITY_DN22667_c0_g1~~TRINITY_DN22667_c0_g1_i5.p1  ORF type:complete len:769 (-),score=192.52 TRINITY_DN22667_c0_g1_i5:55-2112(-)